MYKSIIFVLAVLLISGFASSCSSGGNDPLVPPTQNDSGQELTSQMDQSVQVGTTIWGYFDLYFDFEKEKVEVVPNRSNEFTINIVKFLNNDPMGLQVKFNGTTPGSGYVDLDMDITIKHPLSDHAYDGYDVRGLFIGNGIQQLKYNTDLKYPAMNTDQVLLNADGYSRWFNPTEFLVPKMFGYVPGKLASPGYKGTATLNGYKYFGDGLGDTDSLWDYLTSGGNNVGYFLAGTSNTRNYVIRFPVPMPGVKYGYVILSDWTGTQPQNHPSRTTESVGVKLADNSNVYYQDASHKGGNLKLDIAVFDWDADLTGGVMEDYQINVESTVQNASHQFNTSEMTPTASADHWFTYHVEIPADNITGVNGNEMWVVVEDSSADYTNPLGVPNSANDDLIAACYRFPLTVLNVEPAWITVVDPNGGESWDSGSTQEITWTSEYITTDVNIWYSTDNFTSDINQIAEQQTNDGSYMWDIPEIDSDTVKVRVSSDGAPLYQDESDDYFEICPSVSLITVTYPNGGEVWKVGQSPEITWTADPSILNVKIEVSYDSGASWPVVITYSAPNDGIYQMDPIPQEAVGDTCRIKISDVDDPSVYDVSDEDLSVIDAWINLTDPNGGEALEVGSSFEITWECSETGGTVSIIYTKDDFQSDFNEITSETPNSGSYLWENIPNDLSDTVKVGVAFSNLFLLDGSDDNFSIIEQQPSITVLSPNGSEYLRQGNSFEITWDSFNVPEPVAIYYSKDNFQSDINTIVDNTSNTGSYDWYYIDYDPSDTVRIKIESTLNPSISDISDYDFHLTDGGWAEVWGGSEMDFGEEVFVDDLNNTYVTGYLGMPLSSAAAFLWKLDPSGTLEWEKTWGTGGSANGYSVAVDSDYNIYVTGRFYGTNVDMDPGPGTALRTSDANGDIFLTKFDPSGNFSYTKTWGGFSDWYSESGMDLVINGTDLYVTGYFTGTNVDFNPDAGSSLISSKGGADTFLSKFNTSGAFSWAVSWGGTDSSYGDEGHGVTLDGGGDIYVAGDFHGANVDFDPSAGTSLKSAVGGSDAYLVWFDNTGAFQGVLTWGGTGFDSAESVMNGATGMFVAGSFEGSNVDFNPGAGTDLKSSAGAVDAFLSHFDSLISYQYTKTWGGSAADIATDLAPDSNLYPIVVGYYSSIVDFDPGGGEDIRSSNGAFDAYWTSFDADGNFLMARTWGGAEYEVSYGIATSDTGRIFITGCVMSPMVEFAPTDSPCFDNPDSISTSGSYDPFIVKYMPDGCW